MRPWIIRATLLLVVLALLVLPITPVFAIADPDSISMNSVRCFRNVWESSDLLCVIEYDVAYASDPTEDPSDTFLVSITNGTDSASGTADSGTDTTLVDSILTEANDYWNGYTLNILTTTDSAAPQGETALITDFTASSDTLTFAALTAAVDTGDTYSLEPTLEFSRPLNYYDHNVIGIYADAAQITASGLVWGDTDIVVRVSGNPSYFTIVEGTTMAQLTLSGGHWVDGTLNGTTLTFLSNWVIQVTEVLEASWVITLLTSGGRLNSTGATTWDDAVPGLQGLIPDIYEVSVSYPVFTEIAGSINMLPDATGSYENIPSETGCAPGSHWDCVNDPVGTPDDSTTIVTTSAAGIYSDTYNIEDPTIPTGAQINSVTVFIDSSASTCGDWSIRPILRLGGNETIGPNLCTAGEYNVLNRNLDRPGGGSWVLADMDSLQVGIRHEADAGQTLNTTQVYVHVEYSDFTQVYQETLRSRGGSRLTDALSGFGGWLGVSGGAMGAVGLALIALVIGGRAFTASGSISLVIAVVLIPILLLGTLMGMISLAVTFTIAIVLAVVFGVVFILGRMT